MDPFGFSKCVSLGSEEVIVSEFRPTPSRPCVSIMCILHWVWLLAATSLDDDRGSASGALPLADARKLSRPMGVEYWQTVQLARPASCQATPAVGICVRLLWNRGRILLLDDGLPLLAQALLATC